MSLVQPNGQSLADAGLALVSSPGESPPPARRRQFEVEQATRERVPLLIGLTGPSGSGKTFSALRLATGIARAAGRLDDAGGIVIIDTDSRRAGHYADQFRFSHLDFAPPCGSLDYLEALRTAAALGPAIFVVDSLSHEHDGEGGMLDAVTAEPTETGFTPVAGPEFLFELTCCALLKPQAQGQPVWESWREACKLWDKAVSELAFPGYSSAPVRITAPPVLPARLAPHSGE